MKDIEFSVKPRKQGTKGKKLDQMNMIVNTTKQNYNTKSIHIKLTQTIYIYSSNFLSPIHAQTPISNSYITYMFV